ncbi:phage scaffolding protein [Gluconobacter japonicus]|uniref:phage scaffolding protein n=1 Tax=Gluconobacter japonicus TaxID=376620 RepID=UPI001B8BC1CF|nr:phage scaffolding protein [Gluconobacter japonicus]MBS1050485.1 phage scaffolding protein [Gluconobacter japonicus]
MSEENPIDPNTVRELERARADIKAIRAELKDAHADVDRARKERDGFKGQLETQKNAFEAQLAEAKTASEKATADHEAALTQLKTAGERAVMEAQAETLATRLGAHNPADVVRLVDLSAVKRGEDGKFEGLAEALEAAKTERAYLFGEPPKTGAEQGRTITAPAPKPGASEPVNARTMDGKDYEAQKRQFLASK